MTATLETTVSLLTQDPDLTTDLALLEVTDAATFDQPRRDAIASRLLGLMAEEIAAVNSLSESLAREVALVQSRYQVQIDRHLARESELRLAVDAIALTTRDENGYGKKKSRDVGAGTYGYRSSSPAPTLVDEPAYLTWAEDHAPQTLRVKLTMPLAQAREYLTSDELAAVKREVMRTEVTSLIATDPSTLPPGYVMAPAKDTPFAKPLPLAAIR